MQFPVPAAHQGVLATMPEKSFTIQQYADRFSIPYKTAIERLNAMMSSGQVKMGRFRSTDGKGRMCVKNYYQAKNNV